MEQQNEIIADFVITGPCNINIHEAVKQWDSKSFISQWHDEYRLVMETQEIKVTITMQQAIELIVTLDLDKFRSPVFTNGATWRK